MIRPMKRLPVRFYSLPSGREPVREWLRALDPGSRRIIGTDIATVELGWPVGMPVCRNLGDGLWEVRSRISGGRIARVIFVVHEGEAVLLHGFVKKSRKTPQQELTLARERASEVRS